MIRHTTTRCWLGELVLALDERGLCAVLVGDDVDALVADLQTRFAGQRLEAADPELAAMAGRVVACIDDPRGEHDLCLAPAGTEFQRRIWAALCEIPCGETRTYGELAAALGDARLSRAVAGACAANPIAVLIPCHRMVRADGGLSGYRWGVERKRALLEREAAASRAAWSLTPG